MDLEALNKIAIKMVEPGTGILAADESTGTIGKRLASIEASMDCVSVWQNIMSWVRVLQNGAPSLRFLTRTNMLAPRRHAVV